jgi:hypothetical protein
MCLSTKLRSLLDLRILHTSQVFGSTLLTFSSPHTNCHPYQRFMCSRPSLGLGLTTFHADNMLTTYLTNCRPYLTDWLRLREFRSHIGPQAPLRTEQSGLYGLPLARWELVTLPFAGSLRFMSHTSYESLDHPKTIVNSARLTGLEPATSTVTG